MKEDIKNTCQKILELNERMNSLLNDCSDSNFNDFNDQLQSLINEKEEHVKKLFSFKQNHTEEFNRIKETDLNKILGEINHYEKDNLQILNEKKVFLSEEINKTNNTEKALSGYKFKKQTKPKIIDETDSV